MDWAGQVDMLAGQVVMLAGEERTKGRVREGRGRGGGEGGGECWEEGGR